MWLLLGLELLISSAGCARSSIPLDMAALDRSQDHWRIAALYSQEAIAFHQRAEELSKEAVSYEQIFGADSEWVSGAKLLAQFYENAAKDREHQADLHLELANPKSALGSGVSRLH
jgi:hypothetical protein